ncbi:PAS and ANTAR domain-containing protein [Promicromonospora sp. NPDC059942]|uniref:PAS and ANTAR domain-containing protein n=1 Tax=Promicromonospora sp. NPDC059942 TaxID=3347009 RepID=UPI003658E21E
MNHTVGRYRYDVATDEWWWSDEMYRIHGFEPGDVVPTTALILAHKHPDDPPAGRQAPAGVVTATGQPFSSVHRIMDARGQERTVVVVGQGRRDPDTRRVVELVGYFIDVTAGIKAQANRAANSSIQAAAATRAPIEQAKGIIAFALGIDSAEAFQRLRSASNDTNVAVRDVARQIVELTGNGSAAADVVAVLSAPQAAEAPEPPV